MILGVGGTLAYYAILLAIFLVSSYFNSDAGMKIAFAISLPLFPSMIPGCLFSVLLAFLGVNGFGGFHDTGFAVCPLISAPLVNSCVAYVWIKRRAMARAV